MSAPALTLPAIRVRQRALTLYVTALTPEQLADRHRIDYWTETHQAGYQRPLLKSRVRKVREFLIDHQGTIPTALLLCARKGGPQLRFSGDGVGTLTLPEGCRLWVVDGQTRLLGTLDAKAQDAELNDFPFVAVIMENLDAVDEMLQFHIINTTSSKVPTDISDQHLVTMAGRTDIDLTEREQTKARAALIVEHLHKARGVWHGQVKIPNVKGREKGLAKFHALVTSLQPVLGDAFVRALDADDVAQLVHDYWEALRWVCPVAFAAPKEHAIQASAGIFALHMILPDALQAALARSGRRIPGKADFVRVLDGLRKLDRDWQRGQHKASFWAKQGGHDLGVALGFGAHRKLAQLLRQQLPKPPARRGTGREEEVASQAKATSQQPLAATAS